MTPKEKAKKLFEKFDIKDELSYVNNFGSAKVNRNNKAKTLALLCVDELIEQINLPKDDWFEERLEYLEDVKDELNQL